MSGSRSVIRPSCSLQPKPNLQGPSAEAVPQHRTHPPAPASGLRLSHSHESRRGCRFSLPAPRPPPPPLPPPPSSNPAPPVRHEPFVVLILLLWRLPLQGRCLCFPAAARRWREAARWWRWRRPRRWRRERAHRRPRPPPVVFDPLSVAVACDASPADGLCSRFAGRGCCGTWRRSCAWI